MPSFALHGSSLCGLNRPCLLSVCLAQALIHRSTRCITSLHNASLVCSPQPLSQGSHCGPEGSITCLGFGDLAWVLPMVAQWTLNGHSNGHYELPVICNFLKKNNYVCLFLLIEHASNMWFLPVSIECPL